MSKVVIVGSGITGCAAALDLGQAGHDVTVIESNSKIGGKVLSFCCKATDECSRCGVCVAHDLIGEALRHPRIDILTGASIAAVRKTGKRLTIRAMLPRLSLSTRKCVSCDACVAACPVKAITKHIRGPVVQYVIDRNKCLLAKGRKCNKCAAACPKSAISQRPKPAPVDLAADAVIVAIGHEVFDASRKPGLEYGRAQGVLSAEEAEEILSKRNYLNKPGEDVAFIQCVGSRDAELGRNYCSAVCCGYAVRMARILNHRNPESKATIYYIDLQNFDKTFSAVRAKLPAERVNIVRAVPFSIRTVSGGKLKLVVDAPDGAQRTAEHDAVVLSVGMGPRSDAELIARMFGLNRDEFGFLSSDLPGVYVAGTCAQPQTSMDCVTSARAAAADIAAKLPPARLPARTYAEIVNPEAGRRQAGRPDKKSVSRRVLVIGAGVAGKHAATMLRAYRLQPVVVESDTLTGPLPPGVETHAQSRLTRLSGQIGAFSARIDGPDGPRDVACGAVVVASGVSRPKTSDLPLADDGAVWLKELEPAAALFAKREVLRSIGLVLDLKQDETPASTRLALDCALSLREQHGCEVYIFCRDVRVAAGDLEAKHTRAREAGVTVVKYEGELKLLPAETGAHDKAGIAVRAFDSVLGSTIEIRCDLVGISPYGVSASADPLLAAALDVETDSQGQLQENNVRLFPELTSRPGIFAVGACRGQYEPDRVIAEARSAAARANLMLSPGRLNVYDDNAVVDAEKCALCLTCIRTCPHGAMTIDEKKRAAVSLPEVCMRCGVCVPQCPAKAISLPGEKAQEALTE